MSPFARDALCGIVEELFKEANKIDVRSLQATSHDTYESVRLAHLKASALATICDDPRLSHLLSNWSALQSLYLPQVKKKILKSREGFKEDVDTFKPSADKVIELEARSEKMWTELQRLKVKPSRQERKELDDLDEQIDKEKAYKDQYNDALRALQCLDRAVEDLDKISKLEGIEAIHYHIPSGETILEQLKKGEYKGIPFEPFQMMKSGLVSVIAQPSAVETDVQTKPASQALPVQLQDKPKELSDLLRIKEAIDKMPVGRKFNSSYLRKLIPEPEFAYSTKAVGNYVLDAAALFGVAPEGRDFTKIARPALSEQDFIGGIIDHLKPSESGAVNEFYIQRALIALRENCKGYEGFVVEDVYKHVNGEDGFPISRKGVAVNLGRFPDRYGVSHEEIDGRRVFKLVNIEPTPNQITALETAVKSFSFKQFTPDEACKAVFEKKLGIVSPRLVNELLDKYSTELGIERIKDSPQIYRRRERPTSAQADLKKSQVDADETAVF